MKKILTILLLTMIVSSGTVFFLTGAVTPEKDFIRYAEFNAPYEVLKKAMDIDINSYGTSNHMKMADTVAYLASLYYNDFSKYSEKDLDDLISKINSGSKLEALTSGLNKFKYYQSVYSAALGGLVGEYEEKDSNGKKYNKYGIKAYSPIPSGFAFSDYDDFGASRSYGYKRKHLGHDMLCEVGTPIICIEEGTVECIGWNQYGGWRIGIRSKDRKRYYYYAHLRKNRPYHADIYAGKEVCAGDVIGYAGRTGYSTQENVNNIEIPHLHWGLELVFDESQKESDNEIWIDIYAITKLLSERKAEVRRNAESKEFYTVQ